MLYFSQWFNRIRCLITSHPGVVREWEWLGTNPQWKERQDMWTCIRCGKEFTTVPTGATSYISSRPHMDRHVVDFVNTVVEEHGIESVRVRALGDISTAPPRNT